MDLEILEDMGQNDSMPYLHTFHIPGQRKIIQMNPFVHIRYPTGIDK